MSIQTAGDRFLEKLMRHHFGCESPEPAPSQLEPVEADRSAHSAGEAFVGDLLRRFHQDGQYQELS